VLQKLLTPPTLLKMAIGRHLSYSRAISRSQHGFSLAFQTFHEFLGIVRLDPNFFQAERK